LRLGGLVGAVTQRYMGGLMRHYASELRLGVSGVDRPPVDVNKAARQREGVDRHVIHTFVLVRIFVSWGVRGEFLAQAIQVVVHARVVQHA